eukprot:1483253-Prymnesium_polylepis.2
MGSSGWASGHRRVDLQWASVLGYAEHPNQLSVALQGQDSWLRRACGADDATLSIRLCERPRVAEASLTARQGHDRRLRKNDTTTGAVGRRDHGAVG